MKVAGTKIRHHRLTRRFSQVRLANGICTQATISLIESQNCCPNVRILSKICDKLNLPINSVIIRSESRNKLIRIERLILNHRFNSANQLLKLLKPYQFDYQIDKQRYYCYTGTLADYYCDNRKTLDSFNQVLNAPEIGNHCFYQAWANAGVGNFYFEQKNYPKCLRFLRNAEECLGYVQTDRYDEQLEANVCLRIKVAQLLIKVRQAKTARKFIQSMINLLLDNHLMYRLSDAYALLAKIDFKFQDYHQALTALKKARFFYQIYDDYDSLTYIQKLIQITDRKQNVIAEY